MPAPMMIPLAAIDALLALGITAVIPPGDRAFLHSLRDRPHLDGTVEATIEELGVFGRLRRDYGPKSNGHAPPEEEFFADYDAASSNGQTGTADDISTEAVSLDDF